MTLYYISCKGLLCSGTSCCRKYAGHAAAGKTGRAREQQHPSCDRHTGALCCSHNAPAQRRPGATGQRAVLGGSMHRPMSTAPLPAKLAQGESRVPANMVRTAWVQVVPTPARSMLGAFHPAVLGRLESLAASNRSRPLRWRCAALRGSTVSSNSGQTAVNSGQTAVNSGQTMVKDALG
jgi:hypothetical protein